MLPRSTVAVVWRVLASWPPDEPEPVLGRLQKNQAPAPIPAARTRAMMTDLMNVPRS
jgi:hypothetical protein